MTIHQTHSVAIQTPQHSALSLEDTRRVAREIDHALTGVGEALNGIRNSLSQIAYGTQLSTLSSAQVTHDYATGLVRYYENNEFTSVREMTDLEVFLGPQGNDLKFDKASLASAEIEVVNRGESAFFGPGYLKLQENEELLVG